MPKQNSNKPASAKLKRRKPVQCSAIVVPLVTHSALESLADAAFATACHGFKIAMDGIGTPEEYRRGTDILDLATSTLTRINQTVERHNDPDQRTRREHPRLKYANRLSNY